MKKLLILVISSLLILTACSGEAANNASETQTTTVTTTVTTKAETTTTAEPEPPMTELQVEGMTVKIDPAVWETYEEYAERMEKNGTLLDPEEKKEMESGDYGHVFVLRETDYLLLIDSFPFEGREIEGFGTREEYEEFAETLGDNGFKTEIREKNGLLFMDCITSAGDFYTQTCNIFKDSMHYLFVFGGFEKRTEREYLYDIIENLSFE